MKTRTHRVYSDDRVIVPHRFSADKLAVPPRILSLSEAVVLGFQAFEKAFDGFGESLVCSHL